MKPDVFVYGSLAVFYVLMCALPWVTHPSSDARGGVIVVQGLAPGHTERVLCRRDGASCDPIVDARTGEFVTSQDQNGNP